MSKEEQKSEWVGVFKKRANSSNPVEAYETQLDVLDNLFPPQRKKKLYSLPEWYMENRENDLILYYAFGFLHPSERERLYHHMVRWANGIMEKEKSALDPSRIAPDGSAVISVPRPTVSRFFHDWVDKDNNFAENENLLMRLQRAMQIIANLDEALYNEGIRESPDEWVSAVDELMCQDEYPQGEDACWVWMNRMAAPRNRSLFCMDLSETRASLEELNWFRINRVMADYRDFTRRAIVKQRIHGEVKLCRLRWISAKGSANQRFSGHSHRLSVRDV